MTRGQRVAVRRGQLRRRTAYVRPEFEIVVAPTASIGAAMDRWRRAPKWKRKLASGYLRDALGELLGDPAEQPIILLEPTDAPIPDFIRDYWRGRTPLPPFTVEDEVRHDAKLYYRIANTLGDAAAAECKVREFLRHPLSHLILVQKHERSSSDPPAADVETLILEAVRWR